MHTLVLRPGIRNLSFATVDDHATEATRTGLVTEYRSQPAGQDDLTHTILHVLAECGESDMNDGPSRVAIHVPYGGMTFKRPVVMNSAVRMRLERLVPEAPLHVPVTLALAQACHEVLPDTPVVLVFETAFFTRLPLREQLYALAPGAAGAEALRRYGYHGLYHQAACHRAQIQLKQAGLNRPGRILSLCLEPTPEAAAVIGQRPVMVTSGATGMDGLPGQTACGQLDASIVLAMARELKLGAEQINTILTRESGLAALMDSPVSLGAALTSSSETGDFLRYRLLLAAGSAVAVMGGLDAIVFSGRHAKAGEAPAGATNRPSGQDGDDTSARNGIAWPCVLACRRSLALVGFILEFNWVSL